MPPKHKDKRKGSNLADDGPYQSTGYFHTDFNELCHRAGVEHPPEIFIRPKPPYLQAEAPVKEGKKKDDKRKKEEEPEQPEVDEFGDPLPKTFHMQKNKLVYFRPQIHVEMDNPDKEDTVTEIQVRGCVRFDTLLMGIFSECIPLLERLHTISLWNAGLTDEAVHIMATFIPKCSNLKTLILDGNSTARGSIWHELIEGETNPIVKLSLRHCGITADAARRIGGSLGNAYRSLNSKLITLNLAGNPLGDEGAIGLIEGLVMNRTLLCLNMSNCGVGDGAAKKFGEVLSRFSLTHDQVVERRRLRVERNLPTSTASERERERSKSSSPVSSGRVSMRDRVASSRSGAAGGSLQTPASAVDKSVKREKSGGKSRKDEKPDKGKGQKKEDKNAGALTKRGPSEASTLGEKAATGIAGPGGTKGGTSPSRGPKAGGKTGKGRGQPSEVELGDLFTIFPLLDDVEYADGVLFMRGNFTLLSLNLARNEITEEGAEALWRAINYQNSITRSTKAFGTGLMRLVLFKNQFSLEGVVGQRIAEIMVPRDPFYKPPPPATPSGGEHDSVNATPNAPPEKSFDHDRKTSAVRGVARE